MQVAHGDRHTGELIRRATSVDSGGPGSVGVVATGLVEGALLGREVPVDHFLVV